MEGVRGKEPACALKVVECADIEPVVAIVHKVAYAVAFCKFEIGPEYWVGLVVGRHKVE